MFSRVMYAKKMMKIHQPTSLMYQKKKKPPVNEVGLRTKCDVWSKSTRPRVFPVADVANDGKSSAKSKNSIPSLMANGIDALTRRKIATWEQKRIKMADCQNYEFYC